MPPDGPNFAFVFLEDPEEHCLFPAGLNGKLEPDTFNEIVDSVWGTMETTVDKQRQQAGCCGMFNSTSDKDKEAQLEQAVCECCVGWNSRLETMFVSYFDAEGIEGLCFYIPPILADGMPNPAWFGEQPSLTAAQVATATLTVGAYSGAEIDSTKLEAALEEEANEIMENDADPGPPMYDECMQAYEIYMMAHPAPAAAQPIDDDEVVWQPVSHPWQELCTNEGSLYYYNWETQQTQWEHPTASGHLMLPGIPVTMSMQTQLPSGMYLPNAVDSQSA